MGISTEEKYLIKSLSENQKYEAKRLLKCFLTKTSLSGLKALIKKVTTQVLWFDVLFSGRPHTVSTVAYVCCQVFDQRFQSIKTSVFVSKQFEQSLCSIFLTFSKRFDQVLIFSANSHPHLRHQQQRMCNK